MNLDYKFIEVSRLSNSDKHQLQLLQIKLFPKFKKMYKKSGWYSYIKPNYVLNVYDRDTIIGTGKVIIRKAKVNNGHLSILAFGVLVDTSYQKKGIASKMINLFSGMAADKGVDCIFCTTESEVLARMLITKNFKNIHNPVSFLNSQSNEIEFVKEGTAYVRRLTNRSDMIVSGTKIFLGEGPL